MPAADTTIVVGSSPAARSAPTDTDTWFVTGATTTTTAGAYEVRNIDEFDTELGAGSTIRPLIDLYFRLGGAKAVIAPAADAAGAVTALAQFTPDLGPGQVSAPGLTTDAVYEALLAHAADRDNNRFAILDGLDDDDAAAIIAAVSVSNGRYGELWVPRAVTRTATLAYSAVQAALYARNDLNGVGRGQPPAGKDYGIVGEPVIGLSQPAFTKANRDSLDDAGISLARVVDDQVASWSNRTLDTTDDARYEQSSQMRVMMALTAQFKVVGTRYEHKRIDPHRHLMVKFGNDLEGVCNRAGDDLWAFSVNVGPSVNTDATIAARELHADIELTTSPSVGPVTIRLVQNLLTNA